MINMFLGRYLDIINEYGLLILQGVGVTLLLSLVGTLIGLIIAFFFGIIRVQKRTKYDSKFIKFIKFISTAFIKGYVIVIRGTPMIVQATIFYFGFYSIGIRWSSIAAGLFTVIINTTAYLTEVIRGGIESIDNGQMEAARAIGMSNMKAMLFIIIPQALKNSMASIGNEFIINIKDTAVLSVINVQDLFRATNTAAGSTYFFMECMLIAAAIYLILTYGTSKLLILFEKKIGAPVKEITSSN